VEYDLERGRPSYRGVPVDELDLFSGRSGIRVFVPDEPGMDAGQISERGIARLKARLGVMAKDHSVASFAFQSVGATHYVVWSGRAPHRLIPVKRAPRLSDAPVIRNFLDHGLDGDELLIAYTDSPARPSGSLFEMVTFLVRSLTSAGWDSAQHGNPALTQTSPEEAARARSLALRDELLARGWPTSAQVAKALGSRAGNAAQYAAKKRAEGKLFGVWSLQDNTFVHPDFQFDASHQLHPAVPALLHALGRLPGMSDKEDAGGWKRAFWLYGETPALSERALDTGTSEAPRSAAAVFASNPDAVIALADKEAAGDPNAEW
jgi:hypothetical protein